MSNNDFKMKSINLFQLLRQSCFVPVIWVCALLASKSRKSKFLNEKDIERKFTRIITKQLEHALKSGNGDFNLFQLINLFIYLFIFYIY